MISMEPRRATTVTKALLGRQPERFIFFSFPFRLSPFVFLIFLEFIVQKNREKHQKIEKNRKFYGDFSISSRELNRSSGRAPARAPITARAARQPLERFCPRKEEKKLKNKDLADFHGPWR